MNSLKTGYYFCTKEFYNKLKNGGEIKADNRKSIGNEKYAYDYIFNNKKINKGNGMFFLWGDKNNKGNDIKYCTKEEASYILLELEMPKDICIETNYDNWCSFIMDLYEANGDYELADEICREEFGIKNGLDGSYDLIYDTDCKYISQLLVPYIKYNWIKNIYYVENKVV